MNFVKRRTTVVKESYQCKSLNILGTDLSAFSNVLNKKNVGAFKKYLLVTQGWEASSVQTRTGISDKILVTLGLEAGGTRLDPTLPNTGLEKDQ